MKEPHPQPKPSSYECSSAASLGYIDDPFVKHFIKHSPRRTPLFNRGKSVDMHTDRVPCSPAQPRPDSNPDVRRGLPVIGTYCRIRGIQDTVAKFIDQFSGVSETQVVSLGAGYDTTYFVLKVLHTSYSTLKPSHGMRRMHAVGLNAAPVCRGQAKGKVATRYYEIDFAEITSCKAMMISRKRTLKALLDLPIKGGGLGLSSNGYYLINGDLREFEQAVIPMLVSKYGFKLDTPTLFLSECVLIYLDPQRSDAIIDWITNSMPTASAILVYEQINPNDRFGQMMIQNLKSRNITLKGLHAYPSLEAQRERYSKRGWNHVESIDIATFHDQRVDQAEKSRLASLEILDEWEEFYLLSRHYCFAFAYISTDPRYQPLFSSIHI
ncbi:carboxy methyl transferase for protein phosphatase 2A [Spiromyces aspiralis]|uniref:Carboxy methyl transferase for protein phosphatase 2A n=1 Tax=Spiromyces aspiralis TaxID=68401 RepID=A0ACC1HTK7_9FUNG|nr:carboxy methyl transferase for protein phosphatase 2A [Spiromyces aspiralis]